MYIVHLICVILTEGKLKTLYWQKLKIAKKNYTCLSFITYHLQCQSVTELQTILTVFMRVFIFIKILYFAFAGQKNQYNECTHTNKIKVLCVVNHYDQTYLLL